jgi:hypothetical protein
VLRQRRQHLEPGGCFVVEVGVPALRRLPPGERFRPFHVGADSLGFDELDVASQGLISHHYREIDGALDVQSVPFRCVWPAELDLMARLAGMTLGARVSNNGSHQRGPQSVLRACEQPPPVI